MTAEESMQICLRQIPIRMGRSFRRSHGIRNSNPREVHVEVTSINEEEAYHYVQEALKSVLFSSMIEFIFVVNPVDSIVSG